MFGFTTDGPVLTANIWTHILVTYTAVSGTAQIFIDGKLVKEDVKDPGLHLSTDWEEYAGNMQKHFMVNLVGFVCIFRRFNN